jgi:hypothetical protein
MRRGGRIAGFILATLLWAPDCVSAAETRYIDYVVEWFDPTGQLIATGWLHLALAPVDLVEVEVVGRYVADRREAGAPPLGPEGAGVRGRLAGRRLELGIRAFLFDAVNVEAVASDADAPRLEGRWYFSENWGWRTGGWRAYPTSAPPPTEAWRLP